MNDCRDFDLLVARALGLGIYFLHVPVVFLFVFLSFSSVGWDLFGWLILVMALCHSLVSLCI